jgi:hypothetical protein
MSYKYTTKFDASISPCEIGEASFISLASLDNLQSLVPKEINFEENIDLMGVAFNAAVVNTFNRNGDGIDSATAAKFTKNFIHKPTNIEHDKEKIVGHIATAGFSEYGTSKIIEEDSIKKLKKPFNIALGAVVYKSANKAFALALQRSVDPEDSYHNKISASWEVGFTDYNLAVGSEKLSEARIVTNEEEKEELKGYLKAYGGNGKTDKGESVYRLIVGNIYPLGIGFTINPAADVKGIFAPPEEYETATPKDSKEKKISQNQLINVKTRKNSPMEETIISELKDLLVEKKFSKEAVASMTSTFADAIKEKDEQYRKDLNRAQEEKEAFAKESEELKSSVEELKTKFEESQKKISEFEAAHKAEQAVAKFNERMDIVDQQFDLEDDDKQFLASELKELDETDEAFASFQEKLNVVWKHKSKEAKAEFDKQIEARIAEEVEKRISKASGEEKSEEEVLDDVESSEATICNSNETISREEKSLRERFSAAFDRSNIEIS